MRVEYLGHAAFLLVGEGGSVLVDPFLEENPNAALRPEEVTPDLILVSHAHHDHLGDAIQISKASGAPILTTPEIAHYCLEQGVVSIGAHMGGVVDRGICTVKIFPAWHSSSIGGRMIGVPCSFVISMDGRAIYHAGDTALFGDMSLIGEEFSLDLALLPIGGWYTMGPEDALRALRLLDAQAVVPMHYNTFDQIRANPISFCKKVTEMGRKCFPLATGDSLEL
jgi:L-ascorbate metabolism protein UlaG (beta-lactamase superfamily)